SMKEESSLAGATGLDDDANLWPLARDRAGGGGRRQGNALGSGRRTAEEGALGGIGLGEESAGEVRDRARDPSSELARSIEVRLRLGEPQLEGSHPSAQSFGVEVVASTERGIGGIEIRACGEIGAPGWGEERW